MNGKMKSGRDFMDMIYHILRMIYRLVLTTKEFCYDRRNIQSASLWDNRAGLMFLSFHFCHFFLCSLFVPLFRSMLTINIIVLFAVPMAKPIKLNANWRNVHVAKNQHLFRLHTKDNAKVSSFFPFIFTFPKPMIERRLNRNGMFEMIVCCVHLNKLIWNGNRSFENLKTGKSNKLTQIYCNWIII